MDDFTVETVHLRPVSSELFRRGPQTDGFVRHFVQQRPAVRF